MKNLLLALVCLVAAAPSFAQQAGDIGAGVIVGNPTGGTAKFWLDGSQAVDVGLGFSTRLTAYSDYLWHGWSMLPQPAQGRLAPYFGLGAQVRAFNNAEFGIRAVAGVSYWLPRAPVEVFAELVPVFRLTPGTSVGLDGGVGARYYWKS